MTARDQGVREEVGCEGPRGLSGSEGASTPNRSCLVGGVIACVVVTCSTRGTAGIAVPVLQHHSVMREQPAGAPIVHQLLEVAVETCARRRPVSAFPRPPSSASNPAPWPPS